MRRNRVQHTAYSLKPTAHCCHNYHIGPLEALWDIAENMKLSEMYLKILSIFRRKGWTHNKRKGCENTGSIWCERELCPSSKLPVLPSSRRALAPKLRQREFFITSSSPSRCVAGVWLINATQGGAVALCHFVLLLCVASASCEQKYSFSKEQGLPLVAMRRFPLSFGTCEQNDTSGV